MKNVQMDKGSAAKYNIQNQHIKGVNSYNKELKLQINSYACHMQYTFSYLGKPHNFPFSYD